MLFSLWALVGNALPPMGLGVLGCVRSLRSGDKWDNCVPNRCKVGLIGHLLGVSVLASFVSDFIRISGGGGSTHARCGGVMAGGAKLFADDDGEKRSSTSCGVLSLGNLV